MYCAKMTSRTSLQPHILEYLSLGGFFSSIHPFLNARDLQPLLLTTPVLKRLVEQCLGGVIHTFQPLKVPISTPVDKLQQWEMHKHFGPFAPCFLPWTKCCKNCRGQDVCKKKACRDFAVTKPIRNTTFYKLRFVDHAYHNAAFKSLDSISQFSVGSFVLPNMAHLNCRELDIVAGIKTFDMACLPLNLVKLSLTILRSLECILSLPYDDPVLNLPNTVEECYLWAGQSVFISSSKPVHLVISANSRLRILSLAAIHSSHYSVCYIQPVFEQSAVYLNKLVLKDVPHIQRLFEHVNTTMPHLSDLELKHWYGIGHNVIHNRNDTQLTTMPSTLESIVFYDCHVTQPFVHPATLTSLHLKTSTWSLQQLAAHMPQTCVNLKHLTLSNIVQQTRQVNDTNVTLAQLESILLPTLESFCTRHLMLFHKVFECNTLSIKPVPRPNLKSLHLWDVSDFLSLSNVFRFDPNALRWLVFRDKMIGPEVAPASIQTVHERRQTLGLVNTTMVYAMTSVYDHTTVLVCDKFGF